MFPAWVGLKNKEMRRSVKLGDFSMPGYEDVGGDCFAIDPEGVMDKFEFGARAWCVLARLFFFCRVRGSVSHVPVRRQLTGLVGWLDVVSWWAQCF